MDAQEDNLNFLHKVYTNDPILFNSYVEKEVKITIKDGNVYSGVVYTVDPVSESIVLLQLKKSTQYSLKIIFSHAIKNVEVISEEKMIIPELFSLPARFSQEMVTKRKTMIKQLLLDNRFPVREEGDILLIEDTVLINPPYYFENCRCTNSIILNRIQNILACTNVK